MRLLDLTKEAGKVGRSQSIWGAVRHREGEQGSPCSQAAFAPLSPGPLTTLPLHILLLLPLFTEVRSTQHFPALKFLHKALPRRPDPLTVNSQGTRYLSLSQLGSWRSCHLMCMMVNSVIVYLSALQGLLRAPAQGQGQSRHHPTNSRWSGKGETYRPQYDQVQW